MAAGDALPIHRLTLYKHGVGFVQRRGTVHGEEVQLRFRAAEVNDALKSLLVVDRGGGQVHGIYYETPADRETLLAECPIHPGDDHTLLDLLRGLRGWRLRLIARDAAGERELRGRLLGVELIAPGADNPPDPTIALLEDASGAVTLARLGELVAVHLLEERARQDLDFFLQSSRGEEAHRGVTIRLPAGEHDLLVSYLVPSPTWRVSYRLVAETAPEAPDGDVGAGGSLLLQGWGLFDNRLEEDLAGVEVTLVAGQPISFIYDLAASRIPDRPVVADAARVAAAPVEFSAALAEAAPEMRVADAADAYDVPSFLRQRAPRSAAAAAMPVRATPPPATIADLAAQAPEIAAGDLGELFTYRVLSPVTVRRGESALVPIIGAQLPYRRELLFNERKLAAHPVAALRFTNATGLVLERGPVTVLEDGEYRGEALVPFSKDGAEVYLAFAVELGIAIQVERETSIVTAGLHIASAMLDIKQAVVTRTTYRLESTLATPRAVTIEHPVEQGATLVDTPDPQARTAEWYRWSVTCPPRAAATFTVTGRRLTGHSERLLDQSHAALRAFLRDRWLDQATYDRISAILAERSAIAANEREEKKLEAERAQLYSREEQVRKNMAALSGAGEEGALRRRAVDALAGCEERVAAIEARLAELRDDTARRQATIEAELARLQIRRDTNGADAGPG